jgi:DNA-binding LytR/AlgR family response regulator
VNRAKKVAPPAFLVKPFSKDELFTSIEIALYNYSKTDKEKEPFVFMKDAMFVKLNKSFRKIRFDEILFIKSEHVYIEIVTVSKDKLLIRESLKETMHKLPDTFFKVHRSYVVNLTHLASIEGGMLVAGDCEIPIGRNFREELLRKLNLD